MCGMFCFFDLAEGVAAASRDVALQQARLLRHRGPDWSGLWVGGSAIMAHERLAIVDVLHGAQPLRSSDDRFVLAVNGEIYNHVEIRKMLGPRATFRTDSDCEVDPAALRGGGTATRGAAARHVRVCALRRDEQRLADRA
jgi:asparagine synthase (glutamine-hydrolysing)